MWIFAYFKKGFAILLCSGYPRDVFSLDISPRVPTLGTWPVHVPLPSQHSSVWCPQMVYSAMLRIVMSWQKFNMLSFHGALWCFYKGALITLSKGKRKQMPLLSITTERWPNSYYTEMQLLIYFLYFIPGCEFPNQVQCSIWLCILRAVNSGWHILCSGMSVVWMNEYQVMIRY